MLAFPCPNVQAFNSDTNECQCAFEVCGCEYVDKECNRQPGNFEFIVECLKNYFILFKRYLQKICLFY